MVQTSPSALCIQCHQRSKYQDPSGKIHQYCSKVCAKAVNGSSAVAANATAGNTNMCEWCQRKPKYHDSSSGKLHAYCSKTCAAQMKGNAGGGILPAPVAQTQGLHTSNANPSLNSPPNTGHTCQIPTCQKPQFQNSKYCSKSHVTLGNNACLMCRAVEKIPSSHFCGSMCARGAEALGPILLEVPSGHVTFKSILTQFTASWHHKTKCPPVKRVYKIVLPKQVLEDYESYKQTIEAKGHHVAAGRTAGNECRRWHGTRRDCSLGDKGHTALCHSSNCSLCAIIRTSYKTTKIGQNTGFLRFGAGLYASATSSKSNDYSKNLVQSDYKALLLNKVVVGRGYEAGKNLRQLNAPPQGYDSLLGEPGMSLKHDEVVVYDERAIRPSFLVVYDKKA